MQLDTDWNGLSPDSEVIEVLRDTNSYIAVRLPSKQKERTPIILNNTLIEGDIAVFRNPQISPS